MSKGVFSLLTTAPLYNNNLDREFGSKTLSINWGTWVAYTDRINSWSLRQKMWEPSRCNFMCSNETTTTPWWLNFKNGTLHINSKWPNSTEKAIWIKFSKSVHRISRYHAWLPCASLEKSIRQFPQVFRQRHKFLIPMMLLAYKMLFANLWVHFVGLKVSINFIHETFSQDVLIPVDSVWIS